MPPVNRQMAVRVLAGLLARTVAWTVTGGGRGDPVDADGCVRGEDPVVAP